jgi:hypothetical protein
MLTESLAVSLGRGDMRHLRGPGLLDTRHMTPTDDLRLRTFYFSLSLYHSVIHVFGIHAFDQV